MSENNKLLLFALSLLLLLVLGDNLSTYLCLTSPARGHIVSEVNPISAWMFGYLGLVPSIAIQMVLKVVGVVFLYWWARTRADTCRRITVGVSIASLMALVANVNNWWIYYGLLR